MAGLLDQHPAAAIATLATRITGVAQLLDPGMSIPEAIQSLTDPGPEVEPERLVLSLQPATAQAEHGPHKLARAMVEPLLTRTISAVTRRGGALHPAVAPFIAALAG